MNVQLKPGKYVVAVSGGVDSVSLLHALSQLPDMELVVAHFDHGIRSASASDRQFVAGLAEKYQLPFFYEEGNLGAATSEAVARQARYEFLRKVQSEEVARAIITAHHQDDMLETAIINMLRGTGRKGLSSLTSRDGLERPLLKISKSEILDYARQKDLIWREDITNQNEAYLRNYIRRQLLPRFDQKARSHLLDIIKKSAVNNYEIDTLLVKYLPNTSVETLDRQTLIALPHDIAREVIAAWLRRQGIRDFDTPTLERLVVAAKTARPGSRFDALRSIKLKVNEHNLALIDMER